ncbi:uncharacterized protein [Macrobrachium rosenbergii]|uniref:uncharacterized protein n=1 Tax=Macrobrachium rosenbergii TaxID=79674 RepID=UPI0034D5F266
MEKASFLRAIQLHIFEYGIPSLIVSDNGSPIVAGVEQTVSYLNDAECIEFFEKYNIRAMKFHPYPAYSPKLGGLVESMVKQVKRIITSSIRNNILDYFDFEYLISESKMLINKRPIAFKSALTKLETNHCVPVPLTPEMVIKGYDVPCVSIIPQLNSTEFEESWDYTDEILGDNQKLLLSKYNKLKKVRHNLEKLYREEFVANLLHQSIDRKGRYSKKGHTLLKVGDLVCIKSNFSKPFDYPLGVVLKVEVNDLNEVTAAYVRKANGEVVRRHVDNLIYLTETFDGPSESQSKESVPTEPQVHKTSGNREAARLCQERNKALLEAEENVVSMARAVVASPVDLNGQDSTSCHACLKLLSEWQL